MTTTLKHTFATGFFTLLLLLISPSGHAAFNLQLELGGHQHKAVLEKNTALEKQLRNSSFSDSEINQHYTGRLADVADSWLRISNIDGKWQGVVSAFGQLFVVDGNNIALRSTSDGSGIQNTIATRSIDSFDHVQASCGLDGHSHDQVRSLFSRKEQNSALALPQSRNLQQRDFGELCAKKVSDGNGGELCLIAELELAFDQEFQSTVGSSASSHATSIVNIVDGIYRNNFNIAFETVSLTMLNNTNDVFSGTTNASSFLNDIASRKDNESIPFLTNKNALLHVVTGRNFDGSTVGVAYLNVLCRGGAATGTSQLIGSASNRIPLTAIVVAHELGHNFGSGHDSVNNSCSNGFIMYPSVNPNATDFSSCSRTEIQNAIGSIEDSNSRAPLNACFNFPADLGITAVGGNPTSVTLNQSFSSNYTVTPSLSSAALSNASLNGSVVGGEIVSAAVGAQNCTLANNKLGFTCSLNGISSASNVAVNLVASSNQLNLSLATSISDTDLRDIVSSNDSLQVQFSASGGGGGSDTTPDAFSFVDQSGVDKNLTVVSAAISVSGIDASAPISVSGGEYSINNGVFTGNAGTVSNGSSIRVRHTSAGTELTTVNTALTIGGVSGTFTSTTKADPVPPPSDTTPNPFVFSDVDNVATGSEQISNAITVSGINTTAPISVSGGEYSINSSAFTSVTGTIVNGDSVRVRHSASNAPSSRTDTTLTIGGVSDIFTSMTAAAPSTDTTPDAFAFTDVTNVTTGSQQTSNSITVSGIDSAAPINVSGGEYSVNNSAFTADNGTVANGDSVRVRHNAATTPSTSIDTTLTIGGVNDVFSSTTASSPPNAPTSGGNPDSGTNAGDDDGIGSFGLGALLALLGIALIRRRVND